MIIEICRRGMVIDYLLSKLQHEFFHGRRVDRKIPANDELNEMEKLKHDGYYLQLVTYVLNPQL